MPRTSRMLIKGEEAVYHVISRTALDGLPFNDRDKDRFVHILKKLSTIYFAEILGFAVMSNHFHLLVRMHPGTNYDDDEIKKRFDLYYGNGTDIYFDKDRIPFFRNKWSILSEFVKELKQSFSRYYNRTRGRRGTLWSERFKSVLLENGDTLVNCLAYIDLNPVRAGITEKPEDYRWSSLGYHMQTQNKDNFLSLDFGLTDFGIEKTQERLAHYRKYVYESGLVDRKDKASIKKDVYDKEKKKGFEITRVDRFRHRTRYFTDSGIIGSKEFVHSNFLRFKEMFQNTQDKKPKKISGLEGIYSLRKLSESL